VTQRDKTAGNVHQSMQTEETHMTESISDIMTENKLPLLEKKRGSFCVLVMFILVHPALFMRF